MMGLGPYVTGHDCVGQVRAQPLGLVSQFCDRFRAQFWLD